MNKISLIRALRISKNLKGDVFLCKGGSAPPSSPLQQISLKFELSLNEQRQRFKKKPNVLVVTFGKRYDSKQKGGGDESQYLFTPLDLGSG